MRAKLDLFLNKWLSRKLLVFITTAIGLFAGSIESADFVIIAAAYIGTEGVIDAVARLKQSN